MKPFTTSQKIFASALMFVTLFSFYPVFSTDFNKAYADEAVEVVEESVVEEVSIATEVESSQGSEQEVSLEGSGSENLEAVVESTSQVQSYASSQVQSYASASVDIFANGKASTLTLANQEHFTLDWISANVVSCKLFADTQDLGPVSKTGSAGPVDPNHPLYPNPGQSKTFKLECLDLHDAKVADSVVVSAPNNSPQVPAAPTIAATTGSQCGGYISLSWNSVPNATGYKVFRNSVLLTTFASTSFTDQVTPLTQFSYTVQALNGVGVSPISNIATATSSTACQSAQATVDIFANGSQGSLVLVNSENFTLDWISANVVSCKLFADTQDLGPVSKTGSAGPVDPNHPLYPQLGGSKTFKITCLDLHDDEVSDTVTVSRPNAPVCQAPVITSALSASGKVGNAFSYTIFATSSGTSSISYNAQPLPGWLTLATSTGTLSGTPTQAGVFTIEIYATNQCGQSAKDLVITVTPRDEGGSGISVSLNANPTVVTKGQNSTLTWSSTNATACSATWTSATSTSGTQVVSPSSTTEYAITCTKNTQTATATTTITVVEAPVCSIPAITSSLSASGKVGNPFTYIFTATSTGTSTIEYSVSTTSLPLGMSFSSTTQTITGTPTQSGTFSVVISAKNTCGEDSKTLVITIDSNGGGGGNQLTVSLSANPTTITQGQNSTLTWSSTNATACSATWTSATSTSGTQVVSPSSTTEYAITCTNATIGGSATTTVTVNPQNTSGGGSRGSARGGRSSAAPQVLGATLSCDYLKDYLRIDWQNDPVEVIKLQVFLRELEGFRNLPITGIFDQATYDAVGVFQERYEADILTPWGHEESTSFVYILTKKKVNEIVCNRAFPLNSEQEKEIAGFRLFLESLKSQGIVVDLGNASGGVSQGQSQGQISTPVESILSPNGMEFVDLGSLEGSLASTTGTSTVLDRNVQNIAAAIFAGPQGWDESLNAMLLFIVLLLVVYLVVQAIVDRQSRNGSLSFDTQRIRKMSYFTIGIFLTIIGCLLFGIYSIILPLVTLLIVLCIATLWVTFSKKEVRAVIAVPKE